MKQLDLMDVKVKVIAAGLGLAAEDELTMLYRLEGLMLQGIAMGVDLMASRCEAAEQIIVRLTADHNSTPNYVKGFEMAQRHFAAFPNSPIRNLGKVVPTEVGPIFPIARVVVSGDKITEATMCAPGLPDGEHLLYPVLVDANGTPIKGKP